MMRKISITPLDAWVGQDFGFDGRLTEAVLAAGQLERLNASLAMVRQLSPFYRQHLAGCNLALENLADIARLPFTDAADLQREALRFPCVSQDEISRVVTLDTSGTTGQPKRLFFTREDQERTVDFFCWGMKTLTAPGDRVLILFPAARAGGVGDLLATALRRLGAIPVLHGPLTHWRQAEELLGQERFQAVAGLPVPVLALAYYCRHRRMRDWFPQRALLSADYVPRSLTERLRADWNCEAFGHYGMTEMGLGGGVECVAHAGQHIREADLYVEIIDPVSTHPLASGETGEVVFTTLTRRGMPLIRYRTGDFSRLLPGICPCGSHLRRLGAVRGRRDAVSLPGSRVGLADMDESLFAVDGVVDYTALLTENRAVWQLRLKILTWEEEWDNRILPQVRSAVDELLSRHGVGGIYVELQMEKNHDGLFAVGGKRVLERRVGG